MSFLIQNCHDTTQFSKFRFVSTKSVLQRENVQRTGLPEQEELLRLWKKYGISPNSPAFQINSVSVGKTAYRGIFAEREVKYGDLIVSVPWNSVISVSNDAPFEEKHKYLGNTTEILAAKLAESARNTKSIWSEYSHLLPQSLETPATWTPSQLAHLQSTFAEVEVCQHRDILFQVCESVRRLVQSRGLISAIDETEAMWAVQMAKSRSFQVSRNTRTFSCMVPFADMINHKQPNGAVTGVPFEKRHFSPWRCAEDRFEVMAPLNFAQGEEIAMEYGRKSSLSFLLTFGFVPAVNSSDRFVIYDSVQELMDDSPSKVSLMRFKEELLLSSIGMKRKLMAYSGGIAPLAYKCALILHSNSREEIEEIREKLTSHDVFYGNIGKETRKAAAVQLSRRCADILSLCGTTLSEDEIMQERMKCGHFEEGDPPPLALEFRMAMKRTLVAAKCHYSLLAS